MKNSAAQSHQLPFSRPHVESTERILRITESSTTQLLTPQSPAQGDRLENVVLHWLLFPPSCAPPSPPILSPEIMPAFGFGLAFLGQGWEVGVWGQHRELPGQSLSWLQPHHWSQLQPSPVSGWAGQALRHSAVGPANTGWWQSLHWEM